MASLRSPKARARTTLEAFQLLSAFRLEQVDPDAFYGLLVADALKQLESLMDLRSRLVLDVGGGAGYFAAGFRASGALPVVVEPSWDELSWRGRRELVAVVADGYNLPFPDGSFDLVFSSNVLEHVPSPGPFLEEMIRVVKEGGHLAFCYTLWYSPWGGHETSPFHYLSGPLAARLYERRYGRPPKNLYGQSLFKARLSPVLSLLKKRTDVRLVDVRPRYHPGWLSFVVRVPLLREFLTWNPMIVVEKKEAGGVSKQEEMDRGVAGGRSAGSWRGSAESATEQGSRQ